MKTLTISAVLLILAIAQTQAFFTLFEEDLRRLPSYRRQMTDSEMKEAESQEAENGGEAETDPELQNSGKPVGVTQQDITLLRRDVMVAMERLRQTIERHGEMASFLRTPWQYPFHYSHDQQQQ
ncbi:unnamed protein product [Rodentolepis nana]|uniref:Promotilin n=1 Tax=Rodentolepis nana TaxID=102285 RepID=A0A0R3TXV1_RODNA|nr:unnamed protein product [Rodentolepis nana]